MRLVLERKYPKDGYIIGNLSIDGKFFCNTLELPWRENRRGASCIPEGVYEIKVMFSPKFGRSLPRLMDVPGRDGILIHRGNTAKDTSGCILVGMNTVKGRVTGSTAKEQELTNALYIEQKGGGINVITIRTV